MICILIRDLTLRAEVVQLLNDAGLSHCAHDPDSDESISALYGNDIQAAIVEQFIPQIADAAWRDLLGSMGTRIPLFVITASDHPKHLLSLRNDSSISWLKNPTAHQIVAMFTNIFASHAIRAGENDRIIADYTSFVPIEKLRTDKAVSMLKIDGSDFRTISIEFGSEAFISLQNCFQKIIASLWGKRGSLRASDTIVRKTTSPCTYYVFLEKSRVAQAVPAPGVLEMIADRISLQIQEALCLELLKNRSDRILPHCITKIPTFSIGYATILANPSIEFNGAIEQIFDRASDTPPPSSRS